MPLSLFSEATDKDRGKFLDLNLPSFHAVIMIFCLNFCIGRWIGGDILFDSRLVYIKTSARVTTFCFKANSFNIINILIY